jgi:hypothetical protein
MTLRDMGNWASESLDAFLRDLDIVVTASPFDWPIYMVILAIPVVFLAILVFGALLGIPIVIWQEYWKKHFDQEGNPLTRFGKAIDWAWDVVFLTCVFFLIWIAIGFVVVIIVLDGQDYKEASDAAMWAVFVLPTLAASGFLYITIRRRIARAKEGAELDPENSMKL